MGRKVAVEGLRELDKALSQLPKATQRAVMVRTLKKAIKPIVEAAEDAAPEKSGKLKRSFVITTKRPKGIKSSGQQAYGRARAIGLSSSIAREYSRAAGSGPVEIYGGPGKSPQAGQQEWGNSRHAAQPFMRPAWDRHQNRALQIIKVELAGEIKKSAARLAAKALRLSSKG